MTRSPVSLDHLISFVETLHPGGGPLDNLSGAVTVSDELDEQADALIGHFVDQARRSGASWSQIGAAMGVSKQAAQKRFVPRLDATGLVPEDQLFARFAPRARSTLAASGQIAERSGADSIGAAHIAVGLLAESAGVAAAVIHAAGVTDDQIYAAFDLEPGAGGYDSRPAALRELGFAPDGTAVLRETLRAALRLGHNYIGTEHLLLGVLGTEGEAARTLESLGLSADLAGRGVTDEIARIKARLEAG